MKLTVGKVEELIRPFSRGTEVELSCGCCHHSSIGSENILKLKDHTNQTYGYVELEFNSTSTQGCVELNEDKEQWYKAEIEKLKKELEVKNFIISQYDKLLKSLSSTVEGNQKWIQRLKDGF
ncbi:hypothetical protein DVV91_09870 [Clostridium botulinum]|uniref:hypothetical protein n=1 Tax=Clostridium botulinum TaxID=1491 RepID=UPI0019686C83|nr:hypothetical protein [Clostridium botulinum]MBN1074647.1 hypothetical protein [Clostridium botulinum]